MNSGGYEVNLPWWMEDEEMIEDLGKEDITIGDALNAFIGEVQGVLNGNGKTSFIESGMSILRYIFRWRYDNESGVLPAAKLEESVHTRQLSELED